MAARGRPRTERLWAGWTAGPVAGRGRRLPRHAKQPRHTGPIRERGLLCCPTAATVVSPVPRDATSQRRRPDRWVATARAERWNGCAGGRARPAVSPAAPSVPNRPATEHRRDSDELVAAVCPLTPGGRGGRSVDAAGARRGPGVLLLGRSRRSRRGGRVEGQPDAVDVRADHQLDRARGGVLALLDLRTAGLVRTKLAVLTTRSAKVLADSSTRSRPRRHRRSGSGVAGVRRSAAVSRSAGVLGSVGSTGREWHERPVRSLDQRKGLSIVSTVCREGCSRPGASAAARGAASTPASVDGGRVGSAEGTHLLRPCTAGTRSAASW